MHNSILRCEAINDSEMTAVNAMMAINLFYSPKKGSRTELCSDYHWDHSSLSQQPCGSFSDFQIQAACLANRYSRSHAPMAPSGDDSGSRYAVYPVPSSDSQYFPGTLIHHNRGVTFLLAVMIVGGKSENNNSSKLVSAYQVT